MARSMFVELVEEEKVLPRGAKGAFSKKGLQEMLASRAAFAKKVDSALQAGSLTKAQHQELTPLNRRNTLGG